MPDDTVKAKPKNEKVTLYLSPEMHMALRIEGVERKMSLGELVAEAFEMRPRLVFREKEKAR